MHTDSDDVLFIHAAVGSQTESFATALTKQGRKIQTIDTCLVSKAGYQ